MFRLRRRRAVSEKYGCAECGTGPGECCIVVTSDDKFLRSM
jgi:hypothetical protein